MLFVINMFVSFTNRDLYSNILGDALTFISMKKIYSTFVSMVFTSIVMCWGLTANDKATGNMTLIWKCFYTYVSFNPFLIDNMERTTFISVTNENQEYIVKKNVTDYMWDFKLDFKFHMTTCEISNYSKEKFCFWKMCWFPKLL